ncbi:hypothetical protein GOV13_01880 [Candidatus Pacearchaeota archaeon]|nr:hypothetical protein [Candidatus Pacearchaeota archaeon]
MKGDTRGQVSIFIIVAIAIVAVGVLLFMFYPEIGSNFGLESKNPSEFIQDCIKDEVESNVNRLSHQGGSLEPEHYFVYNSEKLEYLCYTNEYYKTCVVQQPMLKRHIEREVEEAIEETVDECFVDLEESFQKKGYEVNLRRGAFSVELLPKRIAVSFDDSLTLTKETSEKFDSISVMVNNNLYELVSIANSIISWETSYGDAETTTYMNYYHDLGVQKKLQSDGTTVYVLTDLNNGNKFQFASRSVAWPPGYGVESVLG